MRAGRPRKPGPRKHGRLISNADAEIRGVVSAARCKAMRALPTQENLRTVRAEWFGCEAGRACVKVSPEKPELWETIKHIRRVTHNWLRAIDAPSPTPRGAWPAVEQPPQESSDVSMADITVTEEERYRRAVAAHDQLTEWVNSEGRDCLRELWRVVICDEQVCNQEAFMAGLRAVAKGMAGR